MYQSGYEWCRAALLRLLSEVTSLLNTQEDSVDLLQVLENQLELVYRELACLEILGILTDRQVTALNLTGQALDEVSTIANTNEHLISRYTPVIELGSVGRPRYYIPQSQLEYLLQSKFSIPQIALLLNVSVRTIRRRMDDYGLSIRGLYARISDFDLDAIVEQIQQQFGLCGNRQMQGHLLSQGIRVQQLRIRESQRRVDPGGVALRRLSSINRRKYKVNGPLALWHIDGNHKLIRLVLQC